jgi:hypothetical protein
LLDNASAETQVPQIDPFLVCAWEHLLRIHE